MKAQALKDPSQNSYMISKKILEINVQHPIIKTLKEKLEADANDKIYKDILFLLYDSSIIISGFTLENPNNFVKKILGMISSALSIEDTEQDNEGASDQ